MDLPTLDARARVLLFAPHPDDESLAAGVFLQRAVAAGAALRVVYATDGENNCWPQRLLECKVRLRALDRRRWGARRRAEALAALHVFGITPGQVEFLSLPDQGVTDLLLQGCEETIRRLAEAIILWRPTHLLLPAAADTHPDHSALAVLLRIACDHFLPRPHHFCRLEYLIHGASATFAHVARSLPQTLRERQAKRDAITCHATQVALSRRRFLAYAKRPERFLLSRENSTPAGQGPLGGFQRSREAVQLQVAFKLKPLRAEETSLYLIGHQPGGGLRRLRATLPGRSPRLDLIDCASGAIAGVGHYDGDAFRARMILPTKDFALTKPIYLKLDRRSWFFDEAGWLEIGALLPPAASLLARPILPAVRVAA